jgi:hypothetical protein
MPPYGSGFSFVVTFLSFHFSDPHTNFLTRPEQMMLFDDRVSAHRWWANQWRILLSALAYTLIEAVRRLALKGTELAQATCQTIRLKLIKIGTVIERKLSLVRLHFSSSHPLQPVFAHARRCLAPP